MQLSNADALLGTEEDFHFFMEVDRIEKSDKDGKRWIQGIASTSHRDLQGEVVQQNGVDYSYFLKHGYINDDHKDGPENKVGEPTECRMTQKGLWLKGFLYPGKERSDYWWEHINVLRDSGSNRKVGFSIQGKVQRREGRTIAKCWLQDVAITASPVNTNTWAEICKSLGSQQWCLHPWDPVCKGGCCTCGPALKSLESGEEDEDKALSAGGMGATLVPQSLEGSAKVQTHKALDRISYGGAIEHCVEQGYSQASARAFVDAIFVNQGIH